MRSAEAWAYLNSQLAVCGHCGAPVEVTHDHISPRVLCPNEDRELENNELTTLGKWLAEAEAEE